MAQQTQFKKLKEQIEAAKRGLTEMADTELDDGPKHDFSSPALPDTVEPGQINIKPADGSSYDATDTRVVDMISKTVLSDTPIADHTPVNSARDSNDEFQFFHREKQLKSSGNFVSGLSSGKADNVESDAFLFERLGRRLALLEDNVEQNRKYILELINLLSQLNFRQNPVNRKLKPSQRLNRRYIFGL